MYKALLILLVLFWLDGQVYALSHGGGIKSTTIHKQIKIDSSKINIRRFDALAIKKYRNDPAFNYEEQKTGLNWWDRFWIWVWDTWARFWRWVAHLLQKLFGSVKIGNQAASVFKYVVLGIAAFMIVYVIFKLIGIDLLRLFKKKQTTNEVPYSESLENIHEINFDEAIENALFFKDYRLAVRLLYLRSLKQLSDSGIIKWKIEKTNSAYLNEITDEGQRRQFSIVTRQFEYVWYGDFPVDGQSFQSINTLFKEFKQRLS